MNQADKTQQASHMNNNALNMAMGGMPGVSAGVAMHSMRPGERANLNTYIYDYFLKYNMHECAHAILREGEVQTTGSRRTSPSRAKRDADGNVLNGIDGAMDAVDQKQEDGDDSKQDLPQPNVPKDCPQGCFLYDWWCLFWDIFGARNGVKTNMAAATYLNSQHAQRLRQEQQQLMLRSLNPQQGLLPGQVPSQVMNPSYQNPMLRQGMLPNGVMVGQDGAPGNMNQAQKEHLMRQAVMNNNNKRVPPQMTAAALKNQQMMQQQANQREQEIDMNGQQPRPQSPAGSQQANSPSAKRRNLGGGDYQELPGARVQTPAGGPNSAQANQAHAILLQNGINPNSLTPQQFQTFQGQNPNAQQKSIQLYAQSLAQHARQQQNVLQQQQGNMPKMPGHVQQNPAAHAGSPMMHATSEAGPMNMIPEYYNSNARSMGLALSQSGNASNPLQDYQMQLMVLEQQNKKRLLMARQQEQEGLQNQANQSGNQFQGMSPQGNRAAPSPQPPSDIKRGTPKMMPQAGPGSPMPDGQIPGQQQRNSPAIPGFNGQVPAEHQTVFYNQMKNMGDMLGANGAAMPNGAMMRPPAHPNFNGQITPQMQEQVMNANLRQQPAGRGQPTGNVWAQHGPLAQTGQPQTVPQQIGPQQGQPQQSVSASNQARQGNMNHQSINHQSMPPPSAPATQTNGRTQPSSPSLNNQQPPTPTQAHKPAQTKRKEKQDRKKKTTAAPVAAPNNIVTPSSEPPTPTPTTPITPQHANSFASTANNLPVHKPNNFGAGQNPAANTSQSGQQPASQPPPPAAVPPPPMPSADLSANPFTGISDDNFNLADFGTDGNTDGLLDNFDFDSFLNNPDEGGPSSMFDPQFAFGDAVEAGATES